MKSVVAGFWFLLGTISAFAQISLGSAGAVLTFDSPPALSEWRGLSVGFDSGAGAVNTEADLDVQVQLLSVGQITSTLLSTTAWPPLQYNWPRWNSLSNLLQSRIGNNWFAVMVATLRNDTGVPLQNLGISYDFGGGLFSAETVPGFRVYYSLSGQSNAWHVIPALSTGATGALAAVLSITPEVWFPGNPLYLLWADENGQGSDGYYTIDNLVLNVAPTVRVTPISANQAELSWPVGWANFQFESTTSLSPANWQPDYRPTTNFGGRVRATENTSSGRRFFRLKEFILMPDAAK